MRDTCWACRYRELDEKGDSVCVNPESEFWSDWVTSDDRCEEFEMR